MRLIYRALNRMRCCMVRHRMRPGAVNAVTALCMRAYYRWQYGRVTHGRKVLPRVRKPVKWDE